MYKNILCMDCIHGLADCLFHGGCIRSVKKIFILRAGITPVNVRICRWVLGIWHQHVCITQHASKSCKAWLRSKSRYVQVHTKYILVLSWYVLVHTQNSYAPGYARGIMIPGLLRRSDVAVLRHKYILGVYLCRSRPSFATNCSTPPQNTTRRFSRCPAPADAPSTSTSNAQ